MSNQSISIKLLNKEYLVTCPEGLESQLKAAAHHLDQTLIKIQSQGKVTGFERIVMMAALNITHELQISVEKNEKNTQFLNSQIERLQKKIDQVLIENGMENANI